MRILVTGARGKVGSATVAALADAVRVAVEPLVGAPVRVVVEDVVPA